GRPPAESAVRSLLNSASDSREPGGFGQWWFGRPAAPGREPVPCGTAETAADPHDPVDRMALLSTAMTGDPAA
ncbi:hypothetical protein NGM37_18855, partial [Streptomyces sp. TRM76130]|nr:hypothetical protein [Streptomyces sp. TRM76130]